MVRNYIAAVEYVERHYEEEMIKKIIDEAPISDIKKEFYFLMVKERKKNIIDKANGVRKCV